MDVLSIAARFQGQAVTLNSETCAQANTVLSWGEGEGPCPQWPAAAAGVSSLLDF